MIHATRIKALGCGHGNRNSVVAAAGRRAFGPANLWSGLRRMVVPNKADPGSSTFRSARTHIKWAAQRTREAARSHTTAPPGCPASLIISESQGHDLANTRWRRLVRRTSRADHTSRQITRQGRSHGKADHTLSRHAPQNAEAPEPPDTPDATL